MRSRLVAGAVRLVDKHGAEGLQVRKLAAAVGTSTMAVYTHFSGMAGIVDAVRAEGYRRLSEVAFAVPVTDDPVTDFAALGLAYRQSAVDNPHLFAMLFGPESYDRPAPGPLLAVSNGADGAGAVVDYAGEVDEGGQHAFDVVIDAARRAMSAGRFREADPASIARQYWAAHHGVVVLEQGGRFGGSPDHAVDTVFIPQTRNLVIGFGDDPDRARISVDRAVEAWRQALRER